ncbi:MAG: hypothetical protein WDW38_009208 [Sanguina aurantia]
MGVPHSASTLLACHSTALQQAQQALLRRHTEGGWVVLTQDAQLWTPGERTQCLLLSLTKQPQHQLQRWMACAVAAIVYYGSLFHRRPRLGSGVGDSFSSDPDGVETSASLVQRTCLHISRAADDIISIFGDTNNTTNTNTPTSAPNNLSSSSTSAQAAALSGVPPSRTRQGRAAAAAAAASATAAVGSLGSGGGGGDGGDGGGGGGGGEVRWSLSEVSGLLTHWASQEVRLVGGLMRRHTLTPVDATTSATATLQVRACL